MTDFFSSLSLAAHAALIAQHGLINVAEWRLRQLAARSFPSREPPLEHRFTPGLYSRTIAMPAGDIIVSELHLTEHQYAITQGSLTVYTEAEGFVTLAAPYVGITQPGTRRLLILHENTLWTTFHPNPGDLWRTPEEVKAAIIGTPFNPLLHS